MLAEQIESTRRAAALELAGDSQIPPDPDRRRAIGADRRYHVYAEACVGGFNDACPALWAPKLTMKLPKDSELLQSAIDETLTYYRFPNSHWVRIRTNNPLERIIRNLRRRTSVIGAFPDGQSALLLCAARLRQVNDRILRASRGDGGTPRISGYADPGSSALECVIAPRKPNRQRCTGRIFSSGMLTRLRC